MITKPLTTKIPRRWCVNENRWREDVCCNIECNECHDYTKTAFVINHENTMEKMDKSLKNQYLEKKNGR